jgi:ferric-dicitrate binding protein FerR (iron transport regulator)
MQDVIGCPHLHHPPRKHAIRRQHRRDFLETVLFVAVCLLAAWFVVWVASLDQSAVSHYEPKDLERYQRLIDRSGNRNPTH